jgi:single stranded DNA-binding protein
MKMAINLNRVTITGHLVRDPVLNGLPSGKSVCEMTVACNRKWQDKLTGEWEEWVDYIKVRAVDSLAPLAHEHLHRGSGVAIDGRLASQPADCEDPEHPLELIVLAEEMQLIPKAPATHQASSNSARAPGAENAAERQSAPAPETPPLDYLPAIVSPMAIEALPGNGGPGSNGSGSGGSTSLLER